MRWGTLSVFESSTPTLVVLISLCLPPIFASVKEDRLVMNSINIHEIGHSYFGDCLVVRRERRDMGMQCAESGRQCSKRKLAESPSCGSARDILRRFSTSSLHPPFSCHSLPHTADTAF